jgi:hypothetical protein
VNGVVSGHITAFFLFDVAEAIDLAGVQRELGGVKARLAPKPTTPAYVQYRQPPITIDGHIIDVAETDGFSVRFKAFDYGVVSVALTRPPRGRGMNGSRGGVPATRTPACRAAPSSLRGGS